MASTVSALYSTMTMDCAFSIFSSISETTTFFASKFLDMSFSSFPKGFGKEKPLRWAQGQKTVFTEKSHSHLGWRKNLYDAQARDQLS